MGGTKAFSVSEVSRHTSQKHCWVVIHGKVYDVTKFLEDHPGGDEVILQSAAKGDATDDFEEVGHTSAAIGLMTCYFIGDLEDSNSDDGPVEEEKQEGFVAAKASEKKQFSSDFMKLISLFIIVVAFVAWYYLNKAKA